MTEIGKAAGQRDLRDRIGCAQRVAQIAAAFLQPPLPYEVAHRRAAFVKQVLQIARRNADELSDFLGVERVVVQMAFDDRLGAKNERRAR